MGEQVIKENMRLLVSQSDEEDSQFFTSFKHRKRDFLCSSQYSTLKLLYLGFLHVVLVLFLLELLLQHFDYQRGPKGGIYTPVSSPVTYVVKTERSNGTLRHNAYTGYPSDENNRAWEELTEPLIFNATAEELVRAGEPLQDSVKVVSGGYMASLGVYHELHCLRRMRLWLYREKYYPNATREDERFMQVHIGHCIEALRLSAMCNVDLGLYSFIWSGADATKPSARSSSPRKCTDWATIDQWSRKRMIPNTHIKLLKGDSGL